MAFNTLRCTLRLSFAGKARPPSRVSHKHSRVFSFKPNRWGKRKTTQPKEQPQTKQRTDAKPGRLLSFAQGRTSQGTSEGGVGGMLGGCSRAPRRASRILPIPGRPSPSPPVSPPHPPHPLPSPPHPRASPGPAGRARRRRGGGRGAGSAERGAAPDRAAAAAGAPLP